MKYENLGQCVGERVVYIRSTDIEQMNWHRLLWSIPVEWYYLWSIGESVELHDITSNSRGGKVKRIFAPVLIDALSLVLLDQFCREKTLRAHVDAAMAAITEDKSLKTHIMFWRGRINKIRLVVNSEYRLKEPNTIYLKGDIQ
jgi:hypothetical protein